MIRKLFLSLTVGAAMAAPAVFASDVDYTKGVFIVNEDWYGHQNSTVNYLLPDASDGNYWHYRVIQTENEGRQLGCTAQFGAIWNGRFYIIAKQAKDPGASVTGGRITVADATTMKILAQHELIDPSGAQCDGRGFVGVTADKGYISSSNGIWIFDLNTLTVKGKISATDNDDPGNSQYEGQTGTMVLAAGRVFAAHQNKGIIVINAADDKVEKTIPLDFVAAGAGIGSIVKAKDGSLWISVAKDCNGTGTPLPYLVKLDPVTLNYETVTLDDSVLPPTNSWYAWTPDTFCASTVENALYWSSSESGGWFGSTKIYKFDIDSRRCKLFVDLDAEGMNWYIYGCSMRVHPVTDEMYMSLYHDFQNQTYITRRYSPQGEIIKDYPMIANYWFPSVFVFPQGNNSPSGIDDIAVGKAGSIALVGNELRINGMSGHTVSIFTATGQCLMQQPIHTDSYTAPLHLQPGIYIVKAGNKAEKFIIR